VTDQLRATDDEGIAAAKQGSVGLGRLTAILDRVEQRGVDAGEASQSLGIQLVVLLPAAVNQPNVPGIGGDRLVLDSCSV
jgi:hypothetical protein